MVPGRGGIVILPKGQLLGSTPTTSSTLCASALATVNTSRALTPLRPALTLLFPLAAEAPEQMTPVLQTLHHFETVTYGSMGSDLGQQIIKLCVHSIAVERPYLMHAVNGISAAHLCHLIPAAQHPDRYRQSKLADAYHWHNALGLFRRELSLGANKENMDALISTVMLICVHQFMMTDPVPDPSQSFVYALPERRPECIRWLTIHHGFQALWGQLEDMVWESVWSPVLRDADFKQNAPLLLPAPADDKVHTLFLELCEVNEHCSPENNALHAPLECLLCLRRLKPSMNTFNKLITFVGTIDQRYYRLLLARDKRALVILAHWLALMTEIHQWWISGRSKAECSAITTFLMFDRDERVKELLEYPARIVGIVL